MLVIVAIWQYLSVDDAQPARRRIAHWSIGTLAFALAMLAKPGAVVTPALAIAIDWLVLGRPLRRAVVRALPWILLAIPCLVWTKLAQPASAVAAGVPLPWRPLVAADSLAFYLDKLIWPVNLGVDYGRTPQLAIARGWVYFTWIIPAIIVTGAVLARRRARELLGGLLIFALAILPVSGIVPFDFQAYSTVADHYMYLAVLGPAMAVAWFVRRHPRSIASILVAAALGACIVLSRLQTRYWNDAVTIFERAVTVNPNSWASHNTLSVAYTRRGDRDRALDHARAAVAANPDAILARFSLAVALANSGKPDEAIDAYHDLIARAPNHIAGRLQLADLLIRQGRTDDAANQYRKILAIDPANITARRALENLVQRSTTRP
jgi:tetratricopeptide (TPR) repeat protein